MLQTRKPLEATGRYQGECGKEACAVSNWENNWEDVSRSSFPDEVSTPHYVPQQISLRAVQGKSPRQKVVMTASLEKMLYCSLNWQRMTQRYRTSTNQLTVLYTMTSICKKESLGSVSERMLLSPSLFGIV